MDASFHVVVILSTKLLQYYHIMVCMASYYWCWVRPCSVCCIFMYCVWFWYDNQRDISVHNNHCFIKPTINELALSWILLPITPPPLLFFSPRHHGVHSNPLQVVVPAQVPPLAAGDGDQIELKWRQTHILWGCSSIVVSGDRRRALPLSRPILKVKYIQ